MTTQNFGYYEEIFFPEDENEWIDSSVFSEVKDLWLKSNNLRGDANYLKACKLLNPFFDVDFDKERMVSHFAHLVTEVDENGWSSPGDEETAYGLRKSIFKEFNVENYYSEEVDSCAVIAIDFRERDEDEEPINNSYLDSPYITVIATKNLDLKKGFKTQDELIKWEEKNEFELSSCFSLDLSDKLTSYLDEDGDETSGYSSEGGHDGVVVYEENDTIESFSNTLESFALASFDAEIFEMNEEAKKIFDCIYRGDIEGLKKVIPDSFDINASLGNLSITAPMPITFSALFFSKEGFNESYGKIFDLVDLSFQEEGSLEEVVYFLASKGADLSFQISPGVSYLGIALSVSDELTNFLVSFGMDVTAEASDALLMAATYGKLAYVNQFLDLGADANFSNYGTTSLMYAAQGESEDNSLTSEKQKVQIEIMESLLLKGADINLVDEGGDTALTNAVRCKNIEIVRFLLEKGANPNGGINKSMSPLEIAIDIKDELVIQALKDAGAKLKEKPKKKAPAKSKEKSSPSQSKKSDATEIPSSKAKCKSCQKIFTKNTLNKWGGTCGACYRKANPRSKKMNKPQPSSSSGCWDTLDSISSGADDCFEFLKIIAILGAVIWFIIAIIIAMFN